MAQENSKVGSTEEAKGEEPMKVKGYSCWVVEYRVNDRHDGYWSGVPKGTGGWVTSDPLEAKQYSKADAELVAKTLDYFPSPFLFSHWIATEQHVFLDGGARQDAARTPGKE